jgi:hypothetical protein
VELMPASGLIRPIARFTAEDIHGPYGFMDQPGLAGTDRLADLGFVNVYENEHVRYDPITECVYAEPMFVPHHNLLTSKGFEGWITSLVDALTEKHYGQDETPRDGLPAHPQLHWELSTKGVGTDCVSTVFAPLEYTGLKAQLTPGKDHDPTGLYLAAKCEGDNLPSARGFYVFHRQVAGDNPEEANRSVAFQFYVSETESYQLEYKAGEGLILSSWDAARTDWRRLAKLQSTQSHAELVGRDQHRDVDEFGLMTPITRVDQAAVQLLLVNNLLQVQVQGQMQPCVVPVNADSFTKVSVIVKGGRYCFWSIHPTAFAASAYMVANEHQLGFVRRWDTPINYHVLGKNPSGCSATASTEWEQGSEFRYKLAFRGPKAGTYQGVDYSRDTSVARSVTYNIPPHIRMPARTGIAQYPIREVQITTAFDWRNLSIVSKADVVVNNRDAEWRDSWPPPQSGFGNRAVTLDLGWQGADGWGAANRRFTGIGGLDITYVRGPAPESIARIACEDLSVILRDYEMMCCPWMDGWCHYYAIRFLAQLAGFTDAQMEFEYCNDPFCLNPNHYHLPIGEGGRPLMYFPPGTPVRSAMQQIQFLTGHLLYFDVSGKLKYYPWVRTSPGPYKRTFYDGPSPNIDPHQVVQQVSLTRSNRTIRTDLTVIGIDAYGPAWRPIVEHRHNERSISDPRDFTYVGYRKPRAVADSRFATQEYAALAADTIFSLENRPSEEIVLTMTGMTDLYPMDVIGLVDLEVPTSAGMNPTPFFITQIVERMICTRSHKDYTMRINARRIV